MGSNTTLPVNLGNPEEFRIFDLANIIRSIVGVLIHKLWHWLILAVDWSISCLPNLNISIIFHQISSGSNSEIQFLSNVEDDPKQRKPNITRAGEMLNWKPRVVIFYCSNWKGNFIKLLHFLKNGLVGFLFR